ncbi:MAG TPA: GxxExxY protein [Tepidisphaeraceae bacterium]|nr:GxxExxY protein [Tepidisphaeraceae bacterium]
MPFDDEEPPYVEPDAELDEWARQVIGAAIEVHRQLGPGLDESFYHNAMKREFDLRRIPFDYEFPIDVTYKGVIIGNRRIDLLVGKRLVVELKAVEQISSLHKAQVLTYLKTNLTLGLLINFNTILLKDGIRRIIRGH